MKSKASMLFHIDSVSAIYLYICIIKRTPALVLPKRI